MRRCELTLSPSVPAAVAVRADHALHTQLQAHFPPDAFDSSQAVCLACIHSAGALGLCESRCARCVSHSVHTTALHLHLLCICSAGPGAPACQQPDRGLGSTPNPTSHARHPGPYGQPERSSLFPSLSHSPSLSVSLSARQGFFLHTAKLHAHTPKGSWLTVQCSGGLPGEPRCTFPAIRLK
jgi:hypothetical protein